MSSQIMVVEDEPEAAEGLVEALGSMGYEVTAAVANAADCLASADERRPDLVLMDINLIGGLDGIETAQMLRDRHDIPVVFLSGYADERTMSRARNTGAFGYLLKPFRYSELKSAVEVALFRHQLECQLRDRERWLTTTLRAIGDAAIALDRDGRVTFMNAAAEQLINAPETSVRGQPLNALIQLLNENTRERLDPLLPARKTDEVVRLSGNTALIAAGRELPVNYSMAPILDVRGMVCGAVAVIEDLTSQRRSQQQVAVADRLASLGVVTAGIAHEINNPLTYVLGNAEFMLGTVEKLRSLVESTSAGDTSRDLSDGLSDLDTFLHDMQQGAKEVARIVADLSVLSRFEATPRTCDVIDRMEWALRVSNSAIVRHARIERRFHPVPPARVEGGRLGQVFLNLLLNAAYAMRASENHDNRLTVSIELDTRPRPGPQHCIRIAIADTGVGMAADVAKRIFEPFFTTKPAGAGSGLGLAVCQSIVSELGGHISVESELGLGSCFSVYVPVAEEEVTSDEPKPRLKGLRGRVLVIDDDPLVLGVLRRTLGELHEVVTSDGAEKALQQMREQSAFDVIVCDFVMPNMDGGAFYRQVLREWPQLASRIIFLTGVARAETEFFSSVPNLVIQKPPDMTELLQAIERHLDEAPPWPAITD